MREHLVFMLHAPLGAMGGIAVGERRGGFDRPGKSAILGLVAAALGIDRADEAAHQALADSYGLGLGEVAPGRLLSDYHTTQAPPRRKNQRFATRRAELADKHALGTILSFREYRSEPAYIVVLWPRATARWSFAELAEALRHPSFTLYFGRKACPLAVPLDARVVAADGAQAAISEYVRTRTPAQTCFLQVLRLAEEPSTIAFDLDEAVTRGSHTLRVEQRRDALVSRRRWQFGLRSERIEGRGE